MRAAKFVTKFNVAASLKLVPLVSHSFADAAAATTSLYKIFNDQSKSNGARDFIRFDHRGQRWTFTEVKKHSLAFAKGLTELGFKSGDKVFVWLSSAESQEFVTAQIGAARIGVTLVTHNSNSGEEIKNILKSSKAKGILVAPFQKIDGDNTRIQLLYSLMPSLEDMQSGDGINESNFPDLKYVIQTSNTTLRGATKLKHIMNYTKKSLFGFELEAGQKSSAAIEHFEGGKSTTFTSADLETHAKKIWSDNKLGSEESVLAVNDLSNPFLVSSCLVGSALSDSIVTCAGTADPKKNFELLGSQGVSTVVCDKNFAEASVPSGTSTDALKKALIFAENGVNPNSVLAGLETKSVYNSSAKKL
mmetsp:Transcript_28603/g.32697  ORF Transcript_28603/g.32697 Transcript_28603/m.32697 type:complete len:361 (+) Transcript_28603:41-1123(+)